MTNEILFYITTAVFLLGLFGIFYSRDLVSALVSGQMIIIAAFVNFLNFSFIAPGQLWEKIFLLLGFMAVYLFIFSVVLSIYSRANKLERSRIIFDYRLFIFKRSDWWGEDRL
jgi:NADH:ubiquinone oxidoreductase subunit K